MQSTPGRPSRFTLAQRNAGLGLALVAPVLITLGVLVIYPFAFAVYISFTDKRVGIDLVNFVGFENFAYLFTQQSFLESIRNTITLVFGLQSMKLILGLGIASLLNQAVRGRTAFRGLVLLPWAMPAFVAYLLWRFMFDPTQGGAFNMILGDLFGIQVDFLSTRELAMPSVIVASFWRGFPFWVISFLAAMQGVSVELYEAAAMDGANAWRRFRHITLPSIQHVIVVVLLLSTIWTTNSFENIWLLTGGGPSNATMTFPVLAYYSLQTLRLGEASAVSVALLPIFAILAFVGVNLLQRED